ncbi:alpha/beta hydrolase [Dietzia sp. Alg238-R159]|uniref:alpha/beta fold hydrolase n=1 Tax=Dietzia sp. Alg238-R159 TaxID=2305986 RepID=UPI0013D116EB|nr:alpha/beta hydrolase [Dietzia sp. Alg238-R159]
MTTQTIDIPHLGGSTIGYRFGREYDPSLPTLVMINSFTTSVELYRPQFASDELGSRMNLLAIEPYGHGATRSRYRHFTYWDSAIAALQVMQALDIDMAFALGTSQGGWIATRMALLDPDAIRGIVVVGTSMDYESQASIERGCWDGSGFCTPAIDALAAPVGDEWVVDDDFVLGVLAAGLGDDVSDSEKQFWLDTYRRNYTGDDGRHRLRTASVNLRDRDGLEARLGDVVCPVLWLQGTADAVYSVANAEDGIARFTGSPSAELQIVEGGQHFLTASDPQTANAATLAFVEKWS